MKEKMRKVNVVLLVIYVGMYLGYLLIKNPIGIAYGSDSYIAKVMYSTNFVPFYFDANVPYHNLASNAMIKMIMLVPAVYFYMSFCHKRNLSEVLSFVIILGVSIELLQVVTLKGYCDITDIIYYVMGCLLFYAFYHCALKLHARRYHSLQS